MREYVLQPANRTAAPQIDYAGSLNEEQLAAVAAPPGPLLVIAGAGSGKTRTLTYRVAWLVEHGVAPENILLLTFTNKAAKEMLGRVGALLPHDLSRMWGGTFHHVGHRILRRHAEAIGYGKDFTIMDADDAADLAGTSLREAGLDPKDKRLPRGELLQSIFGLAINKEVEVAAVIEASFPYLAEFTEAIVKTHGIYQARKRAANVMDYDDLLALSLRLLRENPEALASYRRRFRHVLVDEYQDTSAVQGAFVDLLAAEHRQLMVVGDDAQSIYSWRGANFRNILSFPDRYPGARVIRIETNYRSTPEILHVANHAIAGNKNQFEKNLRAVRPAEAQAKPALVGLEDANLQAIFVAQRILDLYEEGVPLPEIAVLYRSHFHCLELQMELTRRNIPFDVTSGMRFFEQAHIKDVAAYLKFAVNPRDEAAFLRIVQMMPGVGKTTAAKLAGHIRDGATIDQLKPPTKAAPAWKQWSETNRQLQAPDHRQRPSLQIQIILDAIYEDYAKANFANAPSRLEDLNQLRAFAETFESSEEFLAQLALLTNVDSAGENNDARIRQDESAGRVRLSTIHQAKGLEWRHVFVIMLCDGLFPNNRALETDEGEEEERRLFYVAVTRARDELYLTYPRLRAVAGGGDRWQEPSRFLSEIPTDLLSPWKVVSPAHEWT